MYNYYFVLLVTNFVKTNGWVLENEQLVEDSLIANIVSQFNEHDVIFYYDNVTKSKIDSIIPNMHGTVLLGNYDITSRSNNCSVVARPIGYKFLHVILLENYTCLDKYTNATRFSFQYLDIILVVTNTTMDFNETTGAQSPVFLTNVHRAGAFFILNLYNFIVYNVCFYCHDKFGIWQEVVDLTDLTVDYNPSIRNIFMNIYKNQFKDFNGHIFPVGYTIYKPYFWCTIDDITHESRIFDIFGSEGELLILLHEKLNFRVTMIEFNLSENTWSSTIEAVENGTLSWAVGGISLTLKRRGIVEFTNLVNKEPYVILYSVYKNPWTSWRNIVLPFKTIVWISLIITIITISFLFYLAVTQTGIELNIKFNYFLQGCLRLLVEQPIPLIYNAIKTRWTTYLLICLCLIIALVMTNTYKSKLTSSLIHYKADEYDDVEELVNLNYEFYTSNIDSSVLQESFQLSEDEVFLQILKQSKNDTDLCSSIYQTVRNKKAVIDEQTNIQYSIQEYCRKEMTLADQEDLRIVKHILIPNQHAWPMPLNTPYRTVFDSVISRLHAGGIIDKWNSDYAFLEQIVPKSNEKRSRRFHSSRNKVTINSLFGPAFIWVVGLIIATVMFILELSCNVIK